MDWVIGLSAIIKKTKNVELFNVPRFRWRIMKLKLYYHFINL